MERETSTDRVAAIRVPNSPRIDRMSGFPRAARAIAVAALVVLAGSTFLASAAAESHQSSPPSPNVLSGQHGAELVVGDAAVDRIDALFLEYDPSYLEQFAARSGASMLWPSACSPAPRTGTTPAARGRSFSRRSGCSATRPGGRGSMPALTISKPASPLLTRALLPGRRPEMAFTGAARRRCSSGSRTTLVQLLRAGSARRASARSNASRWRRRVTRRG